MNEFKDSKTRHGTTSGFALHQKRDEDVCAACYQAKQRYDKRLRAASAKRSTARIASRAQAYANKMIKQAHPEEYKEYYQQSKAQQREGI